MNDNGLQIWTNTNTSSLPHIDLLPGRVSNAIFRNWYRVSSRFDKIFEGSFAASFWDSHPFSSGPEASRMIVDAISQKTPFAVGRLGGVEAQILMWAQNRFQSIGHIKLPSLFQSTIAGASNAGIRPRNKPSYRLYSKLATDSLQALDLMGCWRKGYEARCMTALRLSCGICNVEELSPCTWMKEHWMFALTGKKVLVVSPFKKSINDQVPKLSKIWSNISWDPDFDVTTIEFPFLIDRDCPHAWWDVYEHIGKAILTADYDVALFGCGGLGLPFAALAKSVGKVGVHMGGHLQLLFGIYGQRHIDQEWHLPFINEYWTRPSKAETPSCAERVEGACYW